MTYLNVDEISSARVGTSDVSDVDGVLLLSGIHAREWAPPDALVSLAADLLEAHPLGTGLGHGGQQYSTADVGRVLDGVNLFIVACVEPDGRRHSQTADPLWRKNRRPHQNGANGTSTCTARCPSWPRRSTRYAAGEATTPTGSPAPATTTRSAGTSRTRPPARFTGSPSSAGSVHSNHVL
jgi:hypothetical protein